MAFTSTDDIANISVRVEREIYDRFKKAAESSHRNVAGEVRHLVSLRVEEFEIEQEAKRLPEVAA